MDEELGEPGKRRGVWKALKDADSGLRWRNQERQWERKSRGMRQDIERLTEGSGQPSVTIDIAGTDSRWRLRLDLGWAGELLLNDRPGLEEHPGQVLPHFGRSLGGSVEAGRFVIVSKSEWDDDGKKWAPRGEVAFDLGDGKMWGLGESYPDNTKKHPWSYRWGNMLDKDEWNLWFKDIHRAVGEYKKG